jgi:hypothetical protein
MADFWDMMPCELLCRYELVGEAYCLHIQGSQITCHHILPEWNLHQQCENIRSLSVFCRHVGVKGNTAVSSSGGDCGILGHSLQAEKQIQSEE